MRVLFQTYALAFQAPGGGERVMEELRSALMARGNQVEFFEPWLHDPRDFDVVHYFSALESRSWRNYKNRYPKLPLVVTPTLNLTSNWRARGRAIAERAKAVFKSNLHSDLRLPNLFLPSTDREADLLRRQFGISPNRIRVLPNGVHPRFRDANPEFFRANSGITGPFVLHVGRFDPVKRQDFLISALTDTSIICVLIGDESPAHPDYLRHCRAQAEKSRTRNFHFISGIRAADPLLSAAYAAAALFALPSRFETFGLAALEAAVSGCPLLLSEGMADPSIFRGAAEFLAVANPLTWRKKILSIFAGPGLRLPAHTKEALFTKFDWARIAVELETEYARLQGLTPASNKSTPTA